MAEAPIKFRCYRCNKPLGAPARKAGAVVNCPQCGSELRIPAPEAAPADPSPPGSPLPPDLATLRPEDIRVEPEFANIVITPARPRPASSPPEPAPAVEPEEAPATDVAEEPEPPAPAETITIGTGDEVVIPPIQFEPPSLAARETPSRGAHEVVLSPAVVLAWSLLVLLAVPLAFLAGLLTGHFLWK